MVGVVVVVIVVGMMWVCVLCVFECVVQLHISGLIEASV